ncbi:hypothetical protein [Amycolatopsis sp. NPDC004378]
MDSLELEARTATVGELACGCLFDLDGTHQVGDWLTCQEHRAPARVTASFIAVPDGLIAS